MAIRLSGLQSGLDTDTIVQELVKAQSQKKEKLVKSQKKLEWKQDAWKTLNSKIYKLYNSALSNLRYQYTFMKKATTVSNPNAVKVITGENAVNGVQSLEIKNLAKPGFLTGGKVKGGNQGYTAETKLSELGITNDSQISVTSNGKTVDITLNENTTIDELLTNLQSAGINASFDEKNQRFFISSKESGTANDFQLMAGNSNGTNALSQLGLVTATMDSNTKALYDEYASFVAPGDTDQDIAQKMNTKYIQPEIDAKRTALQDSNNTIQTTRTDYQNKINDLKQNPDYAAGKTVEQIEQELQQLSNNQNPTDADKAQMETLNKQLAVAKEIKNYETSIQNLNDQETANNNSLATLEQDVTAKYVTKAKEAKAIVDNGYQIGTPQTDPELYANREVGQDATIMLNGAKFTSTDNNFEINGLTFTVNATTAPGEVITVTTQDDTDGIYDVVKNFLKEYNEVIIEMDKLYGAESSKGYEPLTDEEKKSLSESEVEKWEQKIKDSLLRKDSTLNGVASVMKAAMSAGVEVNGKTMFLSDFGINTLGYFEAEDNERYAYHIDGNPDDPSSSGKPDVLKGMIATDPSTVMDFFNGLAKNMYSQMQKIMAKSESSSYNKVYNDVTLQEEYDDYKKKIAAQEERLKKLEDRYYAKFTRMEKAMAKLNSSTNSFASLLGG